MKGNDGTGNVEERDDWQTPQWLFDLLNKQYIFGFDCCASKDNKKCKAYSDSFYGAPVDTNCWMNPPFSKSSEMFERFFRYVKTGVAIYRCDNLETALWQDIILKNATWILIPKGRISYEGKVGKGSRFPSALIGFNVEPPKEVDGTILYLTSHMNRITTQNKPSTEKKE